MVSYLLDADADSEDMDWNEDETWSNEDDEDFDDGLLDIADALQDALADDYADADPEDIDNALADILDSMSAAEAFNFAKALKQVGRTAGKVVSNPIFKQVAGAVLPIGAGAVGTLIGGPVGTALGSSLGSAAAGALTGKGPSGPGVPRLAKALPALTQALPGLAKTMPPVVGGSAAAAQGLVLTQQPDVLKSLLALSLGQHGKKSVNGVPVAQVMNMLSSVFGQAAADADELMYLDESESYPYSEEAGFGADVDESATGRELYATLLDADNAELEEALNSS
jgi:hypothetical protein